jgi:hypothetical protein
MKEEIFDNKFVYYSIIFILLAIAIFGAVTIKKFIGYAGAEVPAEAGTITTVTIDHRTASSNWHGLYGLVFSESGFSEEQSAVVDPGELSSKIFVFDCVDPNQAQQELYASTNNSIDFSNIKAGTTEMIDTDFLNLTNATRDRANNTFTELVNITVGSTSVINVPAVYTYVNDAPDSSKTFFTGILNASGKLVIVARLLQSSSTSFKGTNVKYQMLLPVPNSSTKYYFFADPNDECPAGFGTGQVGDSVITGFVFERNSTIPISGVTVSAGGNSSLTDSNGLFNMTVPGGRDYNLVAIKTGYNTNITEVNTTIGSTTYKNLTMSKFFGFIGPNATISGYVQDNATNEVLVNATISIAGLNTLSNDTGNYSLIIAEGTHVIAAVKNGYDNFVGNFTIADSQNLSFIINMSTVISAGAEAVNGTLLNNGTIQGTVRDNSTNTTLAGVTVTVAGASNITDSVGFYNITALQGTTNLVATKSSYNTYFKEVNISANNITELNFSMSPVTVAEGVGNGTVRGTVFTSSGNVLSDVTVSVAGKSNVTNSTGKYLLLQIPAGTHILTATRSGYVNNISTINVTENVITEHNITMITTTEEGLGAGSGAGKGAGSGAGKGAGSGAGRGPGTGVQAQIEQPTEIKDYEISVKKILKKLRVGNFIGVPITITNNREESVSLRFSVEGNVKDLVRMDKERLIIEGNSDGEVMLTILGNVEPGVYEGYFVISGDINEKIPIYVLVLEKERLAVEALLIKVTPEKKKITAGSELKFRVDLQNLLSDEKYKVGLSYSIEGITNNKSIFIEKEDIVILTSFSLLKRVELPADLEKGDYALKVKAEFLELTSEQSTIFTVTEPIYKYAVFGIIPLWIIFVLVSLLSTGTFSVMVYKKKKAEKQRYQIELDYGQLPKPGPRAAYVGNIAETKNRAYLDLDQFQVHTLVAGSSGSGKSVVAQDLVEEALLKGSAVIVFDPTAQWTGFLRRCQDKKLLGLYPKFGMKKTDARAFNGNIHQVENAREIIDFKKIAKPGEINVFVTNKLETKDIELFVANTIREVFHANLPESRELKYLLVYDGIHSLLPKFGGSGQVFVPIERATREFRKWGVGLILISQVISDFPAEVLANINTEIQMRTRDEGDLNRTKEEYGDKILQSVVKAAVGTGMVENSAYNKGKPYFVGFRPIMHNPQRVSDKELENYNRYNKIIDDLDYQLEQLEKEGIDIFDLRLELKLAQDKVKSGSFNMVDIYLEGLKPRIKAQWEKLGKEPKKREIKYVSEAELEKELEKAKEERKKVQEENAEEGSGITSEAIRKAKEAKAAGIKKEEEGNVQEKQPTTSDERDKENKNNEDKKISSIVKDIHSHIDSGNREELKSSYAKLQLIYKTASKEDKIKILQDCNLIRKKLSEK